MDNIQIKRAKQLLKEYLNEEKIIHSLNVAETAKELATYHGENEDNAYFAGLVHDIARNMAPEALLKISEQKKLIAHPVEKKMPIVLHGPVGSYIVFKKIGVNNEYILNAVKKHTVAAPLMSKLDKIIYVADIIEPGRKFNGLDNLRKLAKLDLNKAFLKALDNSIFYLINNLFLIHPFTIEARNYVIEELERSDV